MKVTWAALAGAVLTEVMASLALQAALRTGGWYVLVVAGYLSAFVLLTVVLRAGMPLGVAYGIWGACGVALTAALGTVLFGQAMTPTIASGIVLIVAGVLVIELDHTEDDPRGAR